MSTSRILIVEDEFIVAMDIEDRLAAMGYELAGRAASGEQALALVEEQSPHLILMDIRLQGDMDGIAAAEEIRRRFHIPVIFLTAYSEDATLERAKLAEPFGYILKPFDDRELKSAIEIALYRHAAEEEIRRLNRLYDVLIQVNQAIGRIRSRKELLLAVCRLVVERGTIDLAWIGWLDPGTSRIAPVAHFGNPCQILQEVHFYADDRPEGQGNPGKAIRECRTSVCSDCAHTTCLFPSAQTPARYGLQSCGSFPIRFQGRVCGTLNVCVAEPGFFREREVELLEEVAMDISFALDKIESDAQRELAEMELRANEERYRAIVEDQTELISRFLPDHTLVFVNEPYCRFFAESAEELIGRDFWHHVPEPKRRSLVDFLNSLSVMNPVGTVEHPVVSPNGDIRWLQWTDRAIFSPEGKLMEYQAVGRDITERKHSEEALRKSEKRLNLALAASKMGVWEWDVRTDTIFWSPECFEILDLESYDGTLESFTNAVHPEDVERVMTMARQALAEGSAFTEEFRVIGRGGEERWVSNLARGEYDENGKPLRLIGIVQDITRHKQAEEERTHVEAQLRQAQKMEALGTLAGGIAHDFNNILGIILGYTEMAQWDADDENTVRRDLQEVLKATSRAKDLVQQILAFSRQSEQEKRPVQVGLIVKEALKMLRASLPSTIDIRTHEVSKTVVLADPTQVHQVLMNLCTNAAHAMRENGGLLEVSLDDVHLTPESIAPHSDLKPGSYAKLIVKDTGHGIDPGIMERIFDPFFTTKELGVGTGLGLSVVHGIVKSHGGAIEFESALDKGTAFQVLLPAMESAPELNHAVAAPLPRGQERLLVVDDEPALAMAAKAMLERLGYEVECRTRASEALETFRLQMTEKPFDLVITDMTMPDLTGADLARELLKLDPGLPILLCTGFNEGMDAEKARSIGIQGFLMKPVVVSELARMIREMLNTTMK